MMSKSLEEILEAELQEIENADDNFEFDKEELTRLGYMQRADVPHPLGGDYSEAYFLDEVGQFTTQEVAYMIMLKGYTKEGKLVQEDFFYRTEDSEKQR